MRFGLRELIFLLVLIGMPIVAYLFVFSPNNDEIQKARSEVTTKQQKLGRLEAVTHQIDDLGREIERLTEVIALFEAKLPAQKEVEVILREVWELAAERDLNPRSVRTEELIQAERYSELPLKMEIVGDFDGFYSFLLDLERLSRITRVHEMKIKRSRFEDGVMEAKFTLTIFFEPAGDRLASL